jgi:hypothetical protein
MNTQSRGHIGKRLFIFDCPFHGRISCSLHPMDQHMLRIEGDLATTSVLTDMKRLRPPKLQCCGGEDSKALVRPSGIQVSFIVKSHLRPSFRAAESLPKEARPAWI